MEVVRKKCKETNPYEVCLYIKFSKITSLIEIYIWGILYKTTVIHFSYFWEKQIQPKCTILDESEKHRIASDREHAILWDFENWRVHIWIYQLALQIDVDHTT